MIWLAGKRDTHPQRDPFDFHFAGGPNHLVNINFKFHLTKSTTRATIFPSKASRPIKKAAHNFGTEMREVTRALTSNLVALEISGVLCIVQARLIIGDLLETEVQEFINYSSLDQHNIQIGTTQQLL
ncbi:hypothetical protein ACJX0J_018789, partial [Zea mays]